MLKILAPLVIFLAHSTSSLAQTDSLTSIKPFAEQPVTVQKAIRPEAHLVNNGLKWSLGQDHVEGALTIDVVLSTLNQFHLYESKTSFRMTPDLESAWNLNVIQKPAVTQFFDPVSKRLVPGYLGQALFRLALTPKNVSSAIQAQLNGIQIVSAFQACSDSVCLFPVNLLINVPISNESTTVVKDSEENASFFSQSHLQSLIAKQLGDSWIAYLILFLTGVLTAFTPCVYPMYPITIGIFSRWSAEKSANPLVLSLLYSLGITTSYSVLGLITASTGSVFGSLTQSPWFLIVIGMILFVSAILFSGLIEFTLPTKLINRVASHNPNSRLGPKSQSFLFGATLGIVASPCVGPVLIAVLGWTSAVIAAKNFNAYFLGFSYLAVFGLGMSFPFLVMSQMILKLKLSPSFGKWTPWIKRIGTVLLVASSLYFLIPGFRFLGLQYSTSTSKHANRIQTYSVYDAPKNVPQLIDFRADWCTACLEIEKNTLDDDSVVKYFSDGHASLVKVDLTVLTSDKEIIAKKYGVLSLPALIFVNKNGEVCKELNTFEPIRPEVLLKKLSSPCMTQ